MRCSGGKKNTTSDATDEIPQLAYLTKSTLKLVIGLRSKQVGLQKCESVAWGGGCCELLLKYHYCDTTHDLQILPCPKLHIARVSTRTQEDGDDSADITAVLNAAALELFIL